ncbi:MAG: hypothetical protein IJ037_13950 [Clostridia bacterium]|nr:hypothetical protein [Clostridia bacterium]MBQ8369646.1 hypothetical protein [Clostridia bacterium]
MDVFAANFARLEEHRQRLIRLQNGLWHEAALFSDLDLPAPDEIGGIYEEICGNNGYSRSLPDFARFCLAFAEVYRGRFGEIFTDGEADVRPGAPKIAYLQNTFSDRAYRVFADEFNRLDPSHQVTAAYFPGFREVCEEVYYGRCSHAMLPVSSSRDGALASFRKLIAKYELKILYETDVDMTDDSVMRFALVRRGMGTGNSRRFADLTVVLTEENPLGAFLSACEILGASAVTVNSYPLEYADDRSGTQITLDIASTVQNALYLFLEGSHIRYEIVGLYDLLPSH